MRVRVPAKINLTLGVGPVAEDGYHPLTTVFQAVSLHDELTAQWDEPGAFSIAMWGEGVDQVAADDSNLAMRAARLVAERFGAEDQLGVRMSVKKSIPVAGGMAGGSANAAAALLACSVLWDLDADPEELRELGAELGADVPFSLMGGTAIGTGRGDKLVPVLTRGQHHWVLAVAEDGLSTPKVFARFDELTPDGGDLEMPTELMNALASGDSVALGKCLRNDLAAAAIDLRPRLQQTLEEGMEFGALGAIVSGSGPTCAFLCRNEEAAVALSVRLSAEGVARAVRRVQGPVPGARLIS
ncbi:4-(cytidine 5'-diphospho)-2-C-methyl-D-erythritol kinase [Naumannella sp. ID2617S]|uniref:4-diphosphocytidyl-2-C-methyl-D-erythritol kinase n=1 Tax=Enemella dayhoffiae TaxID=2016507 RepID=A0A255GQQ3_9ACTN|nr:4-(cytidine 5'-diphospho)-2-C-methyl-D-erythritol kinase [Naumannella sp. ID2617S]OYO18157.1 4-(cytidine 5'-diphospho)-2-C-methyl-D-erythritol kinase [Enemella dayhoffiae]